MGFRVCEIQTFPSTPHVAPVSPRGAPMVPRTVEGAHRFGVGYEFEFGLEYEFGFEFKFEFGIEFGFVARAGGNQIWQEPDP